MKRVKIGYPNNPRMDVLEEIEWIGRNGFDFVDLFLEEDCAVPEKIDVRAVKELLRRFRLDVIGHTAWYLPIGSPVKSFRDAAVEEADRYFAVFAGIGVTMVTIHANWPSGMFTVREGIGFQADTLRKLAARAGKRGLTLMYEPLDTVRDSASSVAEILKRIPEIFLHIDIGHANLSGRRPEDFVKGFRKKLRHVHLHDNDGRRDLHLPMGAGCIDWPGLVRTLKRYYDGTITIEVFSRDRDYALLSRDKLRTMWGD